MSFNVADTDPVRPGIHLSLLEDQGNPFPVYKELREHYPVCQLEPDGLWAISRYDDVHFALKRPDLFSSSGIKALLQPDWLRPECARDLFILMQDPPEHRKYRALLSKAFSERAIVSFIPLMRKVAISLVKHIRADQKVDMLEDFGYPYIGKVLRHITGIEGQSLAEIRQWMGLIGKITPMRPDQKYINELEEAILTQKAKFETIIREKRNNPREDLLSALINAEVDGERLTDDMIRNALDLMLEAGFHTSLQMLCHAIILLSRRPEIMRALAADPQLIPAFTEELLRFESAAPILLRRTIGKVTLSGVAIPEGAFVMLIPASANRDPDQFPNPDEFDMGRENIKQHIAFGHGPHTCLGAALARLEIEIALEVFLSAFDSVSCPPDEDLEWNKSAMARGVCSLPIVFSRNRQGERRSAS